MRKIITLFVILAAAGVLGAQAAPGTYWIESVEYRIDGKTKEGPLSDRLEIKIGTEFEDLAALEAYVADKRQILSNERVLESTDLVYSLGESSTGTIPVTLTVTAKDTWNIIALPYPKYSTNDGLLLSLRIRNYNFLGSMETLYADLDYRYDENGRSSFGLGLSFKLPFMLAGLDWAISTDHYFAYNLSGLITYTDEELLRLYLHGDRRDWVLRLGQGFLWNEDGDDDEDKNKLVLRTEAGISTEFDIVPLEGLGTLIWIPDLEIAGEYLANGDLISASRRGPVATASYTLKAGRENWSGNLREGTVLSFVNSYSYSLYSLSWGATAILQARHYESWLDSRLGLNSRVTLYGNLLGISESIGSYIRGVPDARVDGDYAAFVNLDLPIRLFDIKPSILIKKDWFDFEAHASPFVDAGLVRASPSDSFEPYLAGGLELFGFLKRARSIYARLSLGIDALGYLEDRSFSGNYELFFGLGHDY